MAIKRPVKLNKRMAVLLAGIGALVLPHVAFAAERCAWMNAATASGLLEGSADVVVTSAADQPTVCTFTEVDAAGKRILSISVEVVANDPHAREMAIIGTCGKGAAPLKAIGNEATVCAFDDRRGTLGERVVGRVRDQVFTITLLSGIKDDALLNREALKTRIYTAAEQVAGNLF